MNTSEKNIIELQSKVLFQEDTIERLSKEIRKQQLEISQLKEKVSLIIQSIENQDTIESVNEKPPHY
ncbi:MAG: SlyX family protein [SAR86 cluster bacterium]|nr:SlyX family protein [SAR86 cluster bacterium]